MKAALPGVLALTLAAATRAAPPPGDPPPSVAQTRDYPAADLLRAQRIAIATLQDLGFAIESADAEHGAIAASQLDAHPLRLAISIVAKSDATIATSVTAEYANHPLASAAPAEAFFAAYEAALNPAPEF